MDGILNGLEAALQGNLFLAYGMVLLAGILTSLTPCVYPMIPITVSIVVGQENRKKYYSFFVSLVYVLGIATTYSALGILAVASGSLFGSLSSNIWVLFVIANICILFGLSMLDVFMINIPVLSLGKGSNKKGKGLIGIFLLGIAFGMVASPCTAPVLGSILVFVSTSKSYILGATLLFTYAFGVGTLLILIGTFAGAMKRLPKSGNWMNYIKKFFGYLMIAMGEYFLIQMGKGMF
jgi:thiol:disulfide interchange protein DsbD